jgi:GntR family transcriptional repressor for pyruvate dehydrogenase complex
MTFKSIKIKRLTSQIAEQIRSAILAGEFAPGDKLPSERDLAEMFGVSRPSVREALTMLASSGLVSSHQGGGTVVLSLLDSSDINPFSELIRIEKERALDVIEVRKGIEAWTAYFAAQRALPEDLERMEEIISDMRHAMKGHASSEELDAVFHLSVARATHNFVWIHLMQSIYDGMKDFQHMVWRSINLTGDDHAVLFTHHLEIVEAIRAGKPDAAREAMLDHLSFAEERSNACVGRGFTAPLK